MDSKPPAAAAEEKKPVEAKEDSDEFVLEKPEVNYLYCERPTPLSMLQDLLDSGDLEIYVEEDKEKANSVYLQMKEKNTSGKSTFANPSLINTEFFKSVIDVKFRCIMHDKLVKNILQPRCEIKDADFKDETKYCKVDVKTLFVFNYINMMIYLQPNTWYESLLRAPKEEFKIKDKGINSYFDLTKFKNKDGEVAVQGDPPFTIQRVARIILGNYFVVPGTGHMIPNSTNLYTRHDSVLAQQYHIIYVNDKRRGQPIYEAFKFEDKIYAGLDLVYLTDFVVSKNLLEFTTESLIVQDDIPKVNL